MNPVDYIREKGIRRMFETIYRYKIDKIIQRIMKLILHNIPLQNTIIIESHNDFDSNGGAFYNYLIRNGYNHKYKIVWLIKHPQYVPQRLFPNVDWVPEYRPGIKKNYYKWTAKWISSDQNCTKKLNPNQKSIYLTHGSVGLKDCTGVISLPDDLDYCLTASDFFAPIDAKQYMWDYPNSKMKICGFPVHDAFYTLECGDLKKITNNFFHKVILWMPTFRKGENGRNDCITEETMGIPLIKNDYEYKRINSYLHKNNLLLIIKVHPKQDLTYLSIYETGNIKVITGEKAKKLHIDNIRLMKDVDAMISDYSSAAYDFLHVNRPIAYDFSDLENYTRGIVVDNPRELIAGHEIKELKDLYDFLDDISNGRDLYCEQREKLFKKLFKYHDGNSSRRVAELLGL